MADDKEFFAFQSITLGEEPVGLAFPAAPELPTELPEDVYAAASMPVVDLRADTPTDLAQVNTATMQDPPRRLPRPRR